MTAAHGIAASAVLVAVMLFGLLQAVSVVGKLPQRAAHGAELALTLILGLQVVLGAVVLLGGARPREPLHFLYGAASLGVIPLARSFAAEAPARPRAAVMVGAAVVLLLLLWRLASTG